MSVWNSHRALKTIGPGELVQPRGLAGMHLSELGVGPCVRKADTWPWHCQGSREWRRLWHQRGTQYGGVRVSDFFPSNRNPDFYANFLDFFLNVDNSFLKALKTPCEAFWGESNRPRLWSPTGAPFQTRGSRVTSRWEANFSCSWLELVTCSLPTPDPRADFTPQRPWDRQGWE